MATSEDGGRRRSQEMSVRKKGGEAYVGDALASALSGEEVSKRVPRACDIHGRLLLNAFFRTASGLHTYDHYD